MSAPLTSVPTTRRILVIEDDHDISHLLALNLRGLGHEVCLAASGTEGLGRAQAARYDLIVLDLRLPGIDGLEVCRRLRQRPDYTPILMLTARCTELDRVLGLEIGADDYLTKPFSVPELLARVKALFRRIEAMAATASAKAPPVLRAGELTIDSTRRRATLGERIVELTAKEFDLLAHFAAHPGQVYTRAQLLDAVWGYGHDGYEHTVNSHINRLRAKIEADPTEPRYILTVWGVGYKFSDEEWT
ncbi:MAG: response regulator transcription factor [Gammaproteobacteria bacterium]|nr:response regulator transcription factor [Gammaproteobacteria bacterium]